MRSKLLAISMVVFAMLWSGLLWAVDETDKPANEAVELKIANRSIMLFRATILGEAPASRVKRAKVVISEALDETDNLNVTVDPIQNSYMVLLGDKRAFIVSPKDVDTLEYASVQQAAEGAAAKLRQVVAETQEARSLHLILRSLAMAAVATLIYLSLLWCLAYLRRRLLTKLPELMERHTQALKVGRVQLIDANYLYPLASRLLLLLRWLVILLLTYEWLGFVLSRFPYTRPWGESLNNYLLEVAGYLLQGIVGAIPGLGVALAIFFIARGATAFSRRVLRRMATPGTFSWLNSETLQPTQRLTSLAIWLFALAMAYPYLPGAGTDAFKGLSVLIGLMISLGATSVVGQPAAGLILTYTRTLRPGEFVKIGEYEGAGHVHHAHSHRARRSADAAQFDDHRHRHQKLFAHGARSGLCGRHGGNHWLRHTMAAGRGDVAGSRQTYPRYSRRPGGAGVPDCLVRFLPRVSIGGASNSEPATATGSVAEHAAREHSGCVQRVRRTDHVAALYCRSSARQGGGSGALVFGPRQAARDSGLNPGGCVRAMPG
jgi:small-conductance mechanosensitive channel